ncbi:MAG: hypothetical protein ACTHME_06215, partial [Candidatus Nitrosocosmicus sp.]
MSKTETVEYENNETVETESQTEQKEEEVDVENHPIIVKLKSLQSFEEKKEYANELFDYADLWNDHLKSEVVIIIAEAMKETNTVADKDIAKTVVEVLRGRVSDKQVYQSLGRKYKDQFKSHTQKVNAEKRKVEQTVKDYLPPTEFKTDEELNAEHIAMTENKSIHQLNEPIASSHIKALEEDDQIIDQSGGPSITMRLEDYENLCAKLDTANKQIKALKGESAYVDCQQLVRVIK